MMDRSEEVRRGAGGCKGDYAACVRLILPPASKRCAGAWHLLAFYWDNYGISGVYALTSEMVVDIIVITHTGAQR